jgi:hypothetical protein
LAEYNQRMKLRRVGYTEDIGSLDAMTAEIFSFIADEIEGLEKEAAERRSKRGK